MARALDQRIDDRFGVFARDLYQHHIAGLPLDQGGNLAVLAAEQKIAFPVAGNRSIFDRRRPLADRDRAGDPAVIVGLLRVMPRAAHRTRAPQVRQQLLLQSAAGLDIQRAIDSLVRHLTARIVWMAALEPSCYLLR
jgi:hypothetical protein